MQPILILVIAAVAAIGLGTGFLGNDITLLVQQFGVGEEDIETPIDEAQVDFIIEQVPIPNTAFFKNVIEICQVTIEKPVGVDDDTRKNSELVCKLTDEDGNIIGEGKLVKLFFPPGIHDITISPIADVRDVHDVIIIAHANTYTNEPPE